jgi:hypothetical protein
VGARFGNNSKISNVHGFLQGRLVGHVEKAIEGDVLQHFVHSKFMRIGNHNEECQKRIMSREGACRFSKIKLEELGLEKTCPV